MFPTVKSDQVNIQRSEIAVSQRKRLRSEKIRGCDIQSDCVSKYNNDITVYSNLNEQI